MVELGHAFTQWRVAISITRHLINIHSNHAANHPATTFRLLSFINHPTRSTCSTRLMIPLLTHPLPQAFPPASPLPLLYEGLISPVRANVPPLRQSGLCKFCTYHFFVQFNLRSTSVLADDEQYFLASRPGEIGGKASPYKSAQDDR